MTGRKRNGRKKKKRARKTSPGKDAGSAGSVAPPSAASVPVDPGTNPPALARPVIAPLPSLPEQPPAEATPHLRLKGDGRTGGNPLGGILRQPGPGRGSRHAIMRERGIPMPEEHAPREVMGDAAALFQAARQDRAEEVRQLLGNGADPNLTDDPEGVHRTAIAFMCQNEDIGEETPDGSKFGRTACHMAAARGYADALRALVEGGCNVNAVDHAGKTPLMRAARAGFLEATQLLVRAGAEVDFRDLRQATPLIRAADSGHAEVVRFLLDSGAEVDAHDPRGRTALLAAAAGVHVETVQELLAAGAHPRHRDATGSDALSAVVDAVEPADPNTPSPFHLIPEDRILPIVAMLLDRGARDEPDGLGVRPSQRADERGHQSVAALLRQSGGSS